MSKSFGQWIRSNAGSIGITIGLLLVALAIIGQGIGWWSNLGDQLSGTAYSGFDREDPLVAFKFGLEIEGRLVGYFTSASGIGSQSEVLMSREINPDTEGVLIETNPGQLTWLDVTLQRGITSDTSIWDWRQNVVDGKIDEVRADCAITALNQANEEVARWALIGCWPSRIVGPNMEAGGTDYMVEEIVIVHAGVKRVR